LLGGDCFSGIVGVSYIGNICSKTSNLGVSNYKPLTIFHELGHGFGAQHTFPGNGLEGGGIMDYSDGRYKGTVQFNPRNRNEICSVMDFAVKRGCPYINKISTCGNFMLDPSEECECLGKGVGPGPKKCRGCTNCKLTKKVECSVSTYVVKSPGMTSTVVVSTDLLSSPECCIKGKMIRSPKYTCKKGMSSGIPGSCSLGKCVDECSLYGRMCGFNANGCMQKCVPIGMTACIESPAFLLPVGTPCLLGSISKEGVCGVSGICV
jgi:hypothetical protein